MTFYVFIYLSGLFFPSVGLFLPGLFFPRFIMYICQNLVIGQNIQWSKYPNLSIFTKNIRKTYLKMFQKINKIGTFHKH